jgi:hypothetical protein
LFGRLGELLSLRRLPLGKPVHCRHRAVCADAPRSLATRSQEPDAHEAPTDGRRSHRNRGDERIAMQASDNLVDDIEAFTKSTLTADS